MAIGQCDPGIMSIIKQQPDYEAKKLVLFWILKEIVALSWESGHSSHILYPDLLDLQLELYPMDQNQRSLNVYYRKFMEVKKMLEDHDPVMRINEAAKWEAKLDASIKATSN